ncbi:MAG: cytochrome c biogenesis protein CcdA [Rikenellaceae bacterium]
MKNYFKYLIILCFAVLSSWTASAQMFGENPASWSYSVDNVADNEYDVVFKTMLSEGWQMYGMGDYGEYVISTALEFDVNDSYALVGEVQEVTPVKMKLDESISREVGYYKDSVVISQRIKLLSEDATISGKISWMLCNDVSCVPPAEYDFEIDMSDVPQSFKQKGTLTGSTNFWVLILEAVLWGFAALLTPCVFPMIPMTMSYFLKSHSSVSKGRFLAMMYGIFIVALYTLPIAVIILLTRVLGGDAVTADIFNWLATHWVPNIIFFLIFMVFAASFFGAFEITLPSKLVNSSDEKSSKKGLSGVFFMAITLVIVSFSCTGPIVGSVLIKSTSGEFWEPIITMFAFSMAFALPFILFALFPSLLSGLPKSGGWLSSVKICLGFVELALGLKFLSVADQTYDWGILDREIYLALWIVIFSLLGLFLLGKLRFKHHTEFKELNIVRLFLSIATFTFVVYMIPGMFGAPLKALSGYLPGMHTQDFVLTNTKQSSVETSQQITGRKYEDLFHLKDGLTGFFTLEQGEAYAKEHGKPMLIYFTGHACVNCRVMSAKVWSDDAVHKILSQEYVVVALYLDNKKEVDQSEWITTDNGKVLKTLGRINSYTASKVYKVSSQPTYIVADCSGKPLIEPRGYNLNIKEYIDFLNRGIKAYHNENQ